MDGAYSTDVRILTCPQCGAPVHAASAGGRVACTYCRAPLEVAARNDATVGRLAGPAPTEAERWQGLWAQAQSFRQQPLPPEMSELLRAGPLTPERIPAALALWRSYCQRGSAGDAASAQYAVLLTGAVAGYFFKTQDRVRQRALLESTLDALPNPSHKQVLRCQLAGAAANAGDLPAAQTWFGACDPHSADLLADTAYRCCYANLATWRGDSPAVLAALGPAPGSVPIATTYSVLSDVLRANAIERLGDVNTAVGQLIASARANAGGAQAMQGIAAGRSQPICPQSMPLAIAQVQAHG
jgi:hypothetical protein